MVNNDGLDIQFVQKQWEDSQKLIGDIKARLSSLATASEAANLSTGSIQTAEASLKELAVSSEAALQILRDALEQSLSSLKSIQAVAAQSDFGSIATRLDSISTKQDDLTKIQKSVTEQASTLSQLDKQTGQLVGEVKKLSQSNANLVNSVTALIERIDNAEKDRSQLLTQIKSTVNSLPSRHQAKFMGLMG